MHHRAPGDEEVYRICVGDDDSTRYYLDRFEHFDLGGGPASWNWMAVWTSFIWLVHRRLFAYALGYVTVLPLLVLGFKCVMTQVLGESAGTFFEAGATFLIFGVLVPMFANAAYYRHVNARGSAAIRNQVAEGIKLAQPVQKAVARAYAETGKLPADNEAVGWDADDYDSDYLRAINVIDGMVLIIYGQQADPNIANSTLSFRPVVLDGGRVAWSCGYFQASERDTVYGTNIDAEYLPSECQARSP